MMVEYTFYDLTEVVMSRRIRVIETDSDDLLVGIQYVDLGSGEILCLVHVDMADTLVQMWNEAIEEDEQLSGIVAYKQTCISAVQTDLDRMEDALNRTKDMLKEATKLGDQHKTLLERYRNDYYELYDRVRDMLNSRCITDDDSEIAELRKLLWNADDDAQRDEAEGIQKHEGGDDIDNI